MKVFGKGEASSRAAAIKLAEYLDEPYELPTAPPRQVSSCVPQALPFPLGSCFRALTDCTVSDSQLAQESLEMKEKKKEARLKKLKKEMCDLIDAPDLFGDEEDCMPVPDASRLPVAHVIGEAVEADSDGDVPVVVAVACGM